MPKRSHAINKPSKKPASSAAVNFEKIENAEKITHAAIVKQQYYNGGYTDHIFVPISEILRSESYDKCTMHIDPFNENDFEHGVIYYHKECQCPMVRGDGSKNVCSDISQCISFVPVKCMIKHLGGELLF